MIVRQLINLRIMTAGRDISPWNIDDVGDGTRGFHMWGPEHKKHQAIQPTRILWADKWVNKPKEEGNE